VIVDIEAPERRHFPHGRLSRTHDATHAYRDHEPAGLLAACMTLLVVSGIQPHDRVTWVLEVAPCSLAPQS